MRSMLALEGLDVSYPGAAGGVPILSGVDLALAEGEVLGLVGESGSGKSTLGLALAGLLPAGSAVSARRATLDGADLGGLDPARLDALRGRDVAMVFQDPMAALNPLFKIGTQIVDAQRRKHPRAARRDLWARGTAMLERVGVPDAAARMERYPSEFSGGMRQRVLIAMALLVEPKLLIADEPTTALDATVEVQIAALLRELRSRISGSILLISHSFGLVAETCNRVAVMYAGTIVETGPVDEVLRRPAHPYTKALLACEIDPLVPADPAALLPSIPGAIPAPLERPASCLFAPRCAARVPACDAPPPLLPAGPARQARCWRLAA